MARVRVRKALPTLTSTQAPSVQGRGQRYVPMIPGSGQKSSGYWNQLVVRPGPYSTTFRRDNRFPVLDDTGHAIAAPVNHQSDATRRGGDAVKPNHGAGTPQRKLL